MYDLNGGFFYRVKKTYMKNRHQAKKNLNSISIMETEFK